MKKLNVLSLVFVFILGSLSVSVASATYYAGGSGGAGFSVPVKLDFGQMGGRSEGYVYCSTLSGNLSCWMKKK